MVLARADMVRIRKRCKAQQAAVAHVQSQGKYSALRWLKYEEADHETYSRSKTTTTRNRKRRLTRG
jgi:hypothetical protein